MHIAIKPFVKLSVLIFVPILLANSTITLVQAGVIGVVSGALARTCYTGWRIFHSALSSQSRKPWVAFFVAMVPVVGNLAFPVEFVYRSREED